MGEEKINMDVTPTEARFIEFYRELNYGEIDKVVINKGDPVMIYLATKTIRFDVES